MTKQVSVVAEVVKKDVPLDVVAGQYRFTLSSAVAADVVVLSDTPSATFPDVAPGDYVVKAARLDTSSVVIGDEVIAGVTVPADTQQVDVVSSLTVTLG